MYKNVHCGFICNVLKLETTQISIKGERIHLVCSNRILYYRKKSKLLIRVTTQLNFSDIMLRQRSQTSKNLYWLFYLHEVHEQAKVFISNGNSGLWRGSGSALTRSGREETFWVTEMGRFCFGLASDYLSARICKIPSTFKINALYVSYTLVLLLGNHPRK